MINHYIMCAAIESNCRIKEKSHLGMLLLQNPILNKRLVKKYIAPVKAPHIPFNTKRLSFDMACPVKKQSAAKLIASVSCFPILMIDCLMCYCGCSGVVPSCAASFTSLPSRLRTITVPTGSSRNGIISGS